MREVWNLKKKTDRKKTRCLDKKQSKANPWVVCWFFTSPDLTMLSTCSSMSTNVIIVVEIFTKYFKIELAFYCYFEFCKNNVAKNNVILLFNRWRDVPMGSRCKMVRAWSIILSFCLSESRSSLQKLIQKASCLCIHRINLKWAKLSKIVCIENCVYRKR